MIGAATALAISDIPFNGPTAAVAVGWVDDKIVINPTEEQRHEPLPQHAGERDVPRTPRSELVCRQAVRHAQIPVRSLPQDKRLCRQLLDKPLHRARHLPPAPRQVADLRPHLRPVRFLVACLFQPLRAATSGGKPDGV